MKRSYSCVMLTFLFSLVFVDVSYAIDRIALHNQYVEQIGNYVEQIQRTQKPKYLGYEYFGSDESGFDLPEEIYSLAYKDGTTTIVRNYYDRSLKQAGACPFFYTTNPNYRIKDIRVGGSISVLKKSPIFRRNGKDKYTSEYDAFPIHVYYNQKGIITAIKAGYAEEPMAEQIINFVNGKVGPNLN